MEKRNQSYRFQQRFKGRQVLMTKDGIHGIISQKGKPISKQVPIYKQISQQQ